MLRRRELPVRSPFRLASLPAAAGAALLRTTDPRRALRDLLVEQYGAGGARLTASATHALTLALGAARRVRPHGAILLPAYTCFEVATAAVAVEARVVLYDLDERTLGPDWDALERAAHGVDVAAIVVSPLFGIPVEWSRARVIAGGANAILVADVAQAHGSTDRDRPAGIAGDLVVLSFGRGKGWTGFGGGALLWRPDVAGLHEGGASSNERRSAGAEARTLLSAAVQWTFGRPALFGVPSAIPALHIGETVYHDPTPVCEMTRASASIALHTRPEAAAETEHRRRHVAEYLELLRAADRLPPWADQVARADSGALRFPVPVPGGWEAFRRGDAPWLGAASGYPAPLGRLPALAPRLDSAPSPTPVADRLAATLVTLPTHARTRAEDRRRLVALVAAQRG